MHFFPKLNTTLKKKRRRGIRCRECTFGVLAFLLMGKRLTREGGHIDAALALAEHKEDSFRFSLFYFLTKNSLLENEKSYSYSPSLF